MAKIDKIVELLPKIYCTWDKESLLYYFIEVIAKKLDQVDIDLFQVMKSHWIDYAEGEDLDRLGAIYNLTRRKITAETLEDDTSYRTRIKNFLPQFIGGGTPKAILTTAISALGLSQQLPEDIPQEMKEKISKLYPKLYEFSPSLKKSEALFKKMSDGNHHATLTIENESILQEVPTIIIEAINVEVNILQVVRDESVSFTFSEKLPIGKRLVIGPEGIATIDGMEVSKNIQVISLPKGKSIWTFTIFTRSKFNKAYFDEATFYFPDLQAKVSLEWTERTPLTFEVDIPWNLEEMIEEIINRYPEKEKEEYKKLIISHQAVPRDQIARLIQDVKAAGVEGGVRYYLISLESHPATDRFKIATSHHLKESHIVKEDFFIEALNRLDEKHLMDDRFFISGVFDATRFDYSVFG